MNPATYSVTLIADQVYSLADGKELLADLYLPQGDGETFPVILWLHGGGWRFGDRRLGPDLSRFLAERGFAMASIDYRLSGDAIFPAQVIDVKTSIRWLRSIASQYHLDPNRIGVWGSSAGGHLAACAALSGSNEFVSDEHAGYESQVQAVVDGYGPTDFSRMDEDRSGQGLEGRDAESAAVAGTVPTGDATSFESMLIGCAVSTSPREVQLANPMNYVRAGSPPFLILHGQSDLLVPWQQSQLLYEALHAKQNEVTLMLIERLGHGFFNNSDLDRVDTGRVMTLRSLEGRITETVDPDGSGTRFGFSLVEEFFRAHLLAR